MRHKEGGLIKGPTDKEKPWKENALKEVEHRMSKAALQDVPRSYATANEVSNGLQNCTPHPPLILDL